MAVIGSATFDDQRLQLLIANRARVIQSEGQTERRVRMDPGANRIILFRQKAQVLFRKPVGQGLQVLRPVPAVLIIPVVNSSASFSSQAHP